MHAEAEFLATLTLLKVPAPEEHPRDPDNGDEGDNPERATEKDASCRPTVAKGHAQAKQRGKRQRGTPRRYPVPREAFHVNHSTPAGVWGVRRARVEQPAPCPRPLDYRVESRQCAAPS